MEEPIKIIWKYKNNNRKIQYNIYIFIGNTNKVILKLLEKIKDLSLYDTFMNLSLDEINILENIYGDFWYKKFFNIYHINYIIGNIKSNSAQKKELNDKFSAKWFSKHIENYTIFEKKIFYTYDSIIKDRLTAKITKKGKQREFESDPNEIFDFTLKKQKGGEFDFETPEENDMSKNIEFAETQEEFESNDEEDAENIYESDIIEDNDIKKTNELIEKALDEKKIIEKKSNVIIFDKENDIKQTDSDLRNIYKKYYVLNYIYLDDTIKTIKNKICSYLRMNDKFGDLYLLPSRQYLWCEYYFDNEVKKIMLGQQWTKRNELLQIDIEPDNNIHVYENLSGNLKFLRDDLSRYGNKIKRVDEDNFILYDYYDYLMNNEIYMLDIYNDLGQDFITTQSKNLSDVYVKIYFPKINEGEFTNILNFLQNKNKIESEKSQKTNDMINNDLIIEDEIMEIINNEKYNKKKDKYFKPTYITQSIIFVKLRLNEKRMNLFKIFDNFVPDEKYPIIRFQTPDLHIIFKFSENEIQKQMKNKEYRELLTKWFETSNRGLSFKIQITENNIEKPMTINLFENGKIEYKNQWKEDDKAIIANIKKTYEYVLGLLEKINSENTFKINVPNVDEFKFAFINSIQQFTLPNDVIINHNDLSDFSRLFFPYVSLVIDPRKRISKITEESNVKSKYGTYLRYKRISNYDDQIRIEQRILFFMKNYEYTVQNLVHEISRQFNITEERALQEITSVKLKYPNIKKSRKVLKKLKDLPKYKPPGIGIEIQGKKPDKYKVRLSGVKDNIQLNWITNFIDILIYLYIETYINKKKEYKKLKDMLKQLEKIAKRRFKVNEIVVYDSTKSEIKQMETEDKMRIGFKPEKGQNQWSRSCQNSGDHHRQPKQMKIDDLIKNGYKLNEKNNLYEKTVMINKKKIKLKAVKLDSGEVEIFYKCDPKENGEFIYIGFLSKSSNPYGFCMPCCFKKDPAISENNTRKDFFNECLKMGQNVRKKTDINAKVEKIYILQDSNKIQEGRIGFLPKYLDIFLNEFSNRKKSITSHYLVESENGYLFKQGIEQNELSFLNSIGFIIDKHIDEIRNMFVELIKNDNNDKLFTFLNSGDLRTQFVSRENFINFLETTTYLDFNITKDLFLIPNVFTKNGLLIIVFIKKTFTSKIKSVEKIKEDFYIECNNNEGYNLLNKRDICFVLKENKNYYPIIEIKKRKNENKNIISKFFYNTDIIEHVSDFYTKSCIDNFISSIINEHVALTARETYDIIFDFKNFKPKYQIIDVRNKCIYLISHYLVIPVRPSCIVYDLKIIKGISKYTFSFKTTYDKIIELNKLSDKLKMKPVGIFYDKILKEKNKLYHVIAITLETHETIPIIPENVDEATLNELKLIKENKPLYNLIDKEILSTKNNVIIDERIRSVNKERYIEESYELFRLELSNYINDIENKELKEKISKLIENKSNKQERIKKLKLIIYRLIDDELVSIYKKQIEQTGGGKVVNLIKYPVTDFYQINNNRSLCKTHKSKEDCTIHCSWRTNTCKLGLPLELAIPFVNKIVDELITNDVRSMEIMNSTQDYYVYDVVDSNRFAERKGQKIIKSTSGLIKKNLELIFGTNIPRIGRIKKVKFNDLDYIQLNKNFSLNNIENMYIQRVIPNNNTILRSFINGFYWIKHPYDNIKLRNLGYYSPIQTELVNYFKSIIIDWLSKNELDKDILKYIKSKKKEKNIQKSFIVRLWKNIGTFTNGLVELYVLNKTQGITIYIFDENNEVKYVIDNGIKSSSSDTKYNSINLRYIGDGEIPSEVDAIYYL